MHQVAGAVQQIAGSVHQVAGVVQQVPGLAALVALPQIVVVAVAAWLDEDPAVDIHIVGP